MSLASLCSVLCDRPLTSVAACCFSRSGSRLSMVHSTCFSPHSQVRLLLGRALVLCGSGADSPCCSTRSRLPGRSRMVPWRRWSRASSVYPICALNKPLADLFDIGPAQAFLGIGVGMCIGVALSPVNAKVYDRAVAKSSDGRAPPESRLPFGPSSTPSSVYDSSSLCRFYPPCSTRSSCRLLPPCPTRSRHCVDRLQP